MRTLKLAAIAAAFALIGTTVMAQTPDKKMDKQKEQMTVEQMAQRRTERMTKELSLTDAQAKQVYDLNLEQAKQMQAHRETAKANMEQKKEAMKTAYESNAAEMKTVLTAEQYTKWEQMQKAMMTRGHHKGEWKKPDCQKGSCCAEKKDGKGDCHEKGSCCSDKKDGKSGCKK